MHMASNGRAHMGETRHLTGPAATIDAEAGGAQKLVAAGGVLAAIAASSCCIVPLLLFSLGVSGAWIGNLTRLAPYQPIFVAMTLACLGYGYRLVWARAAWPALKMRPDPGHYPTESPVSRSSPRRSWWRQLLLSTCWPTDPRVTTGEDQMTKLLFGAASAFLLFNTASFAAEKIVTLAVQNMACSACPHIVKGSLPRFPASAKSSSLSRTRPRRSLMTMPRRRSRCSSAPQRTRVIPRRRRAEDAYVRVDAGLDAHLSCLQVSSIRNDAHGFLPILLRKCWMQNSVEAEDGRLLRVLFLRGRAMSVDLRRAGEGFAGVLLLIETAVHRRTRRSPTATPFRSWRDTGAPPNGVGHHGASPPTDLSEPAESRAI